MLPIPWELQEPDLSATLSPDGRTLRIFAVNSTDQAEKVTIQLDRFAKIAVGGTVSVLKDRENSLDSEAMNSHNDPTRITSSSQPASVRGSHFSFAFEPFSVTLLELRLGTTHSGH